MDLLWRLGDAEGRPAWRRLVWGMLPLHASSLCACTYHFFYNAPSLSGLVILQAALTAGGNATLAAGAFAVAADYQAVPAAPAAAAARGPLAGIRALGSALQSPGERAFLASGAAVSTAAAAAIKYGSLLIDTPFQPSYGTSLALIVGPTACLAAALALRERGEAV